MDIVTNAIVLRVLVGGAWIVGIRVSLATLKTSKSAEHNHKQAHVGRLSESLHLG